MGSLRRKLHRPHLTNAGTPRAASSPDRPPSAGGARVARYVVDGIASRAPAGATVQDALDFAHAEPQNLSLLLYAEPTASVIEELTAAWDLHPLLVEDLTKGRQRPKFERYGDVVFIVARSAWYLDAHERVEFAEFHILLRPNAVVVLCQDGLWVDGTDVAAFEREEDVVQIGLAWGLMADQQMLRLGPEAVAYKMLDGIIDGYVPVLEGLDVDKDQIERQVFSGDAAAAERIYRLSQEVIDLKQASASLTGVVNAFSTGFERFGLSEELRAYVADLSDHLTRINAEIVELRDALTQILAVNATLVGQRQNEDMKTISGWAAIFIVPTLIAAIYGMNFVGMPGLNLTWGYPAALLMMVVFSSLLYWFFKRKKWM
ncbi:magnesium and cobalt transport protein CorA [Demequina aurantiaca]|uniref:magnesium and cobalt transport protein CorA n=1 Tax=Demequina aurantiaca TaxID=676200 RepID=UPI003D34E4C7